MAQDDNDDVIKNPHRNQGNILPKENYIPEYIKLGLEPYCPDDQSYYDSSSKKDESFSNKNYNAPKIGEFILMVNGQIISCGSESQVIQEAKSILYGEHLLSKNENISLEDIVILKRLSLKVGVFIDH